MIERFEVPYPFSVKKDGRIQSCKKLKRSTFGAVISKCGRYIEPIELEDGCLVVDFYLNRKYRQYVHRLVAEKFLANPNNYEHVLFKDGDPKNCNVSNLEWCP